MEKGKKNFNEEPCARTSLGAADDSQGKGAVLVLWKMQVLVFPGVLASVPALGWGWLLSIWGEEGDPKAAGGHFWPFLTNSDHF